MNRYLAAILIVFANQSCSEKKTENPIMPDKANVQADNEKYGINIEHTKIFSGSFEDALMQIPPDMSMQFQIEFQCFIKNEEKQFLENKQPRKQISKTTVDDIIKSIQRGYSYC